MSPSTGAGAAPGHERFPTFFDQVPGITLHDPLAQLLGSSEGGLVHYRYADAVRLAGHSCPTVASAYTLTRLALQRLYADATPVRGQVRVSLAEPLEAGTAGVVGAVAGLLTGAAGAGGFKGLAGQFVRRERMLWGQEQPLELRYTRLDTGQTVDAQGHAQRVPAHPDTFPLLQRCLAGIATEEERQAFGAHWQDRVRRLLVDHADDGGVWELQPGN
jgi:hypothetical protein